MRIHLLRQRMLLLVQQLLSFYTNEILEPNWHELERKLRAAQSVDEFMKDHFDFLNTCRKECMLTDYRYLEVGLETYTVPPQADESHHRVYREPRTVPGAVCRYAIRPR